MKRMLQTSPYSLRLRRLSKKTKSTPIPAATPIPMSAARYLSEHHANFYPVGAYIQLFLLSARNATGGGAGCIEVFGVGPIFNLILDYLPLHSNYVVWYKSCEGSCVSGDLVSSHLTQSDAYIAAVKEWIDDRMYDLSDIPKWNYNVLLYSFMLRLRSQADLTGEGSRNLIDRWYEEGILTDALVKDLWIECMWMQDNDCYPDERYYGVKEVPFDGKKQKSEK